MKTVFANEAEVPESLKAKVVKQDDGTFVLEGDGLVQKNKELLADLANAKKVADLLKGMDTTNLTGDKIKAAIAEMESAEQRETQIQQRIQAAVAENSQKLAGKVTEADGKVVSMKSALEKHLIDSVLTTHITAEKGDPRFVAPNLRPRIKVVQTESGDYETRVLNEKGEIALDDKGAPRSVLSLVQEAKADKAYASVFTAPASSGSGTPNLPAQQGGNSGSGGALVIGTDGRISITREQAKDHSTYKQALDLVKGDPSKINIPPPSSLQPVGN